MSDLKILTQDDMAEWFNSHHRDTVTAVREIDIVRATTGRCYIFSYKGIRRSLNDYKELGASKGKILFAQGDVQRGDIRMEPIVRVARERIGISAHYMTDVLKLTKENYLYCEEHFNDSSAFICLQICNILGLNFSKV